jgi:hypothetical protein
MTDSLAFFHANPPLSTLCTQLLVAGANNVFSFEKKAALYINSRTEDHVRSRRLVRARVVLI